MDENKLSTNVPGIFSGGDFITGPSTVIQAIASGRRAALAIDKHLQGDTRRVDILDEKATIQSDAGLALHLRTQTAIMVQHVLGKIDIRELLIEGGATGRDILDRLGWQRFDVIGEYGPGIVKMQVLGHQDQIVTLKPGSYPWPEELLGGNKT